jgi:hypothetical protein
LFDPFVLPERVQHRLMLAGYWQCPAELRDKVDRWAKLDEIDATAAEHQLDLMATILAR